MISFAIVNWKGGSGFGLACIAAEVEANRDLPCELVAVDNGSTRQAL
jgi:hypothetical protein